MGGKKFFDFFQSVGVGRVRFSGFPDRRGSSCIWVYVGIPGFQKYMGNRRLIRSWDFNSRTGGSNGVVPRNSDSGGLDRFFIWSGRYPNYPIC